MFKSKKVLGTLAMDLETAQRFGRVRDIILDIEKRRVAAVILPGKNWLYPHIWFDMDYVLGLGPDVLMVRPRGKMVSTKDIGKGEMDTSIRKLWGLMVFTEQGRLLGYLTDLYLDFPGGTIKGIEISRGFIGDILQGRSFLDSERISAFSLEGVVVKEVKDC